MDVETDPVCNCIELTIIAFPGVTFHFHVGEGKARALIRRFLLLAGALVRGAGHRRPTLGFSEESLLPKLPNPKERKPEESTDGTGRCNNMDQ